MDSKSFTDALTSKLGPLPGYAWVLIGAGGIYYYRRSHPASVTPVATAATSASAPVTPVDTMSTDQAANQLYQSSPYTLDQIQQAIANAVNGVSQDQTGQTIANQIAQIQGTTQNPLVITYQPSPGYVNPFTPPAPTPEPIDPTPIPAPAPSPIPAPPSPIPNPPSPIPASVSPYSNGSTARAGGLAGAGSVRGD